MSAKTTNNPTYTVDLLTEHSAKTPDENVSCVVDLPESLQICIIFLCCKS